MNKMLSALTAVALSIVMVSTVDARARQQKGGKAISREMNANTKALVDNNTPKEDKKDASAALLEILKANPNEFELAQLIIQQKQKMNEVSAKKEQITAMSVGWFDFGNVEYKKAKGELATLNSELAEIKGKISAQEKVVGREESKAVKYAMGGLVVVLGLAVVDYALGSPARGFITDKGTAVWAAIKPVGEGVVEYGREVVKSVRKRLPARMGGLVEQAPKQKTGWEMITENPGLQSID